MLSRVFRPQSLLTSVRYVSTAHVPVQQQEVNDPTLFASLKIDRSIREAIQTEFKFTTMTEVQQKAIPQVIEGKDAFVKAKTGTGKTLAFLIPAFEKIAKEKSHGKGVSVLIISPTRELALQISKEAMMLNEMNCSIMTFIGGVKVNSDYRQLRMRTPDIVIATPGKLAAILKNEENIDHDLGRNFQNLKMVILDEADTLLDMGFKRDMDRIFKYVPRNKQALLYSATLSEQVKSLAHNFLNPNNTVMIDTVGEAVEDQTHQHVEQSWVPTTLEGRLGTIRSVIDSHMKEEKSPKILAFLPTANEAKFMSRFFNKLGYGSLEIHSRLSQSARTRNAQTFRERSTGLLFSSDVSARGMDYPGVTLILQAGYVDKIQYIQRLGRTARAGASGKGVIILSDFESTAVLKNLKGLPLQKLQSESGNLSLDEVSRIVSKDSELSEGAVRAYSAWLGYYNTTLRDLNLTKEQLVALANQYATFLGLKSTPVLDQKVAKKMGLFGVPGLLSEKKIK
jgi:ATP-dependent RNA helicase MSS116